MTKSKARVFAVLGGGSVILPIEETAWLREDDSPAVLEGLAESAATGEARSLWDVLEAFRAGDVHACAHGEIPAGVPGLKAPGASVLVHQQSARGVLYSNDPAVPPEQWHASGTVPLYPIAIDGYAPKGHRIHRVAVASATPFRLDVATAMPADVVRFVVTPTVQSVTEIDLWYALWALRG